MATSATEATRRRQAVIDHLLQLKETEYAALMETQLDAVASFSDEQDKSHNMLEDTQADEVSEQVEARSGAADALGREVQMLKNMHYDEVFSEAKLGAIIKTNQGQFFIAVPANEFEVDGTTYHGISTASPLFQALKGKGASAAVTVNGVDYRIEEIY